MKNCCEKCEDYSWSEEEQDEVRACSNDNCPCHQAEPKTLTN